jgi:hypothetical protein
VQPRARTAELTARVVSLAALVLLASIAVACGPSAETLEAQRVLRSLDVLRDAPSEPLSAREQLVADLERQEAKAAASVRARDACVKAYRLLIEGKTLQARVEKQLATPGGASLDTLRDLAAAEVKIKESADAMPECDRAASDLRMGPARGR